MEWISVLDDLPNEGEDVKIRGNGHESVAALHDGRWEAPFSCEIQEVDSWMPIKNGK